MSNSIPNHNSGSNSFVSNKTNHQSNPDNENPSAPKRIALASIPPNITISENAPFNGENSLQKSNSFNSLNNIPYQSGNSLLSTVQTPSRAGGGGPTYSRSPTTNSNLNNSSAYNISSASQAIPNQFSNYKNENGYTVSQIRAPSATSGEYFVPASIPSSWNCQENPTFSTGVSQTPTTPTNSQFAHSSKPQETINSTVKNSPIKAKEATKLENIHKTGIFPLDPTKIIWSSLYNIQNT